MSLKRFPVRTLRGDRLLHRIHRSTSSPWWFSSAGTGRFDPVGTPMGACYLAETPLGAWVEVFRKTQLLAEAEVVDRSLLAVALGRDLRLADVTSRRALSFGITASIGASERYEESQTFAIQALEEGFDGLRYLLRHDPKQKLYGFALFSAAGEAESTDPRWPRASISIPDALVEEATRRFGYRVLPTP